MVNYHSLITEYINFLKTIFTIYTLLFLSSLSIYCQNDGLETSGDIILYTLPAIALGSTLFQKDYKGTAEFGKGFALNQIITFGLKFAIDKERPNMENNNSFPSAHTSTTFQSAAFIQKRYGWKYGIPAYALASYTGFTRIETDKHDIIDVVAGAIIGIGSSFLFTRRYKKINTQLTFASNKNNFLVGFSRVF